MRKAFTLIEILIVITIIGVLFGTAAVSYSTLTKSARDSRRKADLEQIRAALELYRSSETSANGQYPTFATANCSGLSSIANFSSYLPIIPKDPVSADNYICTSSTSTYSIYSTLEIGSFTQCDALSCGGATAPCEYKVGPYGQITC